MEDRLNILELLKELELNHPNFTFDMNLVTPSLHLNSTAIPSSTNLRFEHIMLSYIVPLIFGLVAVLGLVGNLLVIVVIFNYEKMRNSTNLLILNLAFSDLLFIIMCVPWTAVSYAVPRWPFGETWCAMMQYSVYVAAISSVYTLVLLSLDRYLAVVHAVSSRPLRTKLHTLGALAILWIIILVACTPFFQQHGVYYSGPIAKCVNLQELQGRYAAGLPLRTLNALLFFLLGYLLPFSVVCVLYALIGRRLALRSDMLRACSSQKGASHVHRRVTRMIVVVVVVFGICWLPYHVVNMILDFDANISLTVSMTCQIFSQCLGYMNSCINPILYAFLSENFRRSFRRLMLCSKYRPVGARFQTTVGGNSVALSLLSSR